MRMSPCVPGTSPLLILLIGGMCPLIDQCFRAMDFHKLAANRAWHAGDVPLLQGSGTCMTFINEARIKSVQVEPDLLQMGS